MMIASLGIDTPPAEDISCFAASVFSFIRRSSWPRTRLNIISLILCGDLHRLAFSEAVFPYSHMNCGASYLSIGHFNVIERTYPLVLNPLALATQVAYPHRFLVVNSVICAVRNSSTSRIFSITPYTTDSRCYLKIDRLRFANLTAFSLPSRPVCP